MRVVLLTVLVACGSGDRPEPAEPKDVAVNCSSAAATAASLADAPSREAVRAVVAIRCTEDRWTHDAAACIAAAKDRDAGHRCIFRELTGEQSDRLKQDIQSAIDASVAPDDTTPPPEPADDIPRLTDLYPARGDVTGGAFVVLRGANFTNEARSAKVHFGANEGVVVRIQSDTELIVQSPPGTGTVDIVVTFTPGGQVRIPSAFTYGK